MSRLVHYHVYTYMYMYNIMYIHGHMPYGDADPRAHAQWPTWGGARVCIARYGAQITCVGW